MKTISQAKYARLQKVSDPQHVISALAIDQRGSLKKMIAGASTEVDIQSAVEEFKVNISEALTPFSSSILLDPEYGLPAIQFKDPSAGLLLAYEETGYDASEVGRLPDLLPNWSVKRLKDAGADAIKFLLYYDVDESEEINDLKKAFTERIGSECLAEDMPFFLEILTYDKDIIEDKSLEFAEVKPAKVIGAMKEFSDKKYNVDVLKVEVPVNMQYVEGFTKKETLYTQTEAKAWFKEQDASTNLPYIYLSAGVSSELFQDTLRFAASAGANFNGVLCGRATWKDAVEAYVEGGAVAAESWLKTQGRMNIVALNKVIAETSKAWTDKIKAQD